MKVRTRFQPTLEIEVDDREHAALEHQGLLWSGTDEELAELHADAGLDAPAPAKKTTAGATVTASTDKKEGA